MSRTVSSGIQTAVEGKSTAPIYLLRLSFNSENRLATWDTDISWNGETWTASGAEVSDLSETGASLTLPTDVWLSVVLNDGTRGRNIQIYEYHATASPLDAVLVFTGKMDTVRIAERIEIEVIAASTAKSFPPTSIDRPTFTHLPVSGTTIIWGFDRIRVN